MRLGLAEYSPEHVIVWEARQAFITNIRHMAPEVFEELRSVGWPPDDKALEAWARRHNLDCAWVLAWARLTLEAWHKLPRSKESLSVVFPVISWSSMPHVEEFVFSFRDWWDPTAPWETRAQALERMLDAFKTQVEEYLDRMEKLADKAGYKRAREVRNPEAYKWLVLRVVRAMTCEAIADECNTGGSYPDANVISKATASLAKLIGITLPTRPGRPRKNP